MLTHTNARVKIQIDVEPKGKRACVTGTQNGIVFQRAGCAAECCLKADIFAVQSTNPNLVDKMWLLSAAQWVYQHMLNSPGFLSTSQGFIYAVFCLSCCFVFSHFLHTIYRQICGERMSFRKAKRPQTVNDAEIMQGKNKKVPSPTPCSFTIYNPKTCMLRSSENSKRNLGVCVCLVWPVQGVFFVFTLCVLGLDSADPHNTVKVQSSMFSSFPATTTGQTKITAEGKANARLILRLSTQLKSNFNL